MATLNSVLKRNLYKFNNILTIHTKPYTLFWFELSTITMNHSHSWGESGHEINIQKYHPPTGNIKKSILKKSWLIYQQHNIYKLVLKFIYTKPHTQPHTVHVKLIYTFILSQFTSLTHTRSYTRMHPHCQCGEHTHTLLRNERKQTKQK